MRTRSIPAGEFRFRLDIQEQVETRGGAGSSKISYETVMEKVPCMVKPARGSEYWTSGGQRIVANTTYIFTIKYLKSITLTVKHQIVYDGRSWNILLIKENGPKETLEIMAEVIE